MKMLKRLLKVLSLIVVVGTCPILTIIASVIWIITGKYSPTMLAERFFMWIAE